MSTNSINISNYACNIHFLCIHIIQALAQGFAKIGDNVVIGSRSAVGKGTATDDKTDKNKAALIKEYGLVTFADAAKQGDIIVVCIPFKFVADVLKSVKEHCENKLVISTGNPVKFANGQMGFDKDLLNGHGSAGELVQATLDKSHVVKTLNIIGYSHMVNPNPNDNKYLHNPTMFLCGNDENSKKTVNDILVGFGWKDIIDVGDIKMSCHLESMCVLWIQRSIKTKGARDHVWAQMIPQKK